MLLLCICWASMRKYITMAFAVDILFRMGIATCYCMMTSFTWFTPLWCSQSSLCHRGVMKAKLLFRSGFNFSLISRASLCSRIPRISQTADWFSSGDDARQIPLDSMSHDEMSDEVWDNLVLHPSTHILSNQGFLLCTQSSFTFHGLFINFALPTHILLRILWVGFLDESQDFLLWCKTKNKLGYFTQKDDWFLNPCSEVTINYAGFCHTGSGVRVRNIEMYSICSLL